MSVFSQALSDTLSTTPPLPSSQVCRLPSPCLACFLNVLSTQLSAALLLSTANLFMLHIIKPKMVIHCVYLTNWPKVYRMRDVEGVARRKME